VRGSWGGDVEDKGTEVGGELYVDVDSLGFLIAFQAFALRAAVKGWGHEV